MFKWIKNKFFKDDLENIEEDKELEEQEELAAERKAKEAEELKRQEELEAERQAKEVEELKRQEELAAERQAKEAEELKRQEELAAERQAKEAEELKRQEELAAERQAKEVEELKRQEELEAERKAKEAEELKRQEELEAERQAKEAEELKRQEELAAERKAKEAEELKRQEELEELKRQEELEELKRQEELEELKRQEELEAERKVKEAEELKRQEELEAERQAKEAEELKRQEELEKKPVKLSFFDKLKKGLTKTRDNFTEQISSIVKSYQKVDEELLEELEEALIMADVGMETTMDLVDNLRDRIKTEKVTDPNLVMDLLKDEIQKLMYKDELNSKMNIEPSPAVILVVGVNGVGKTTTIGKMASKYQKEGKKVLVAAGDTFRAAAIEQLEEWGKRAGVDIISQSEGSDPAAVIFDGVQAAKSRNADILICDTAGRLHNKANLMNELNKIARVLEREYPDASKEVLLVLDATTGQNAMSQAKVFKEAASITGIALTKLDGTAKGGVVIALQAELGVPIKFVGVGEGIDDLQPFNSKDFIDAIFDIKE